MVRLGNFDMIKIMDRRSFAKFFMVELKTTRRIYAMEGLTTDDDYIDWVQTATKIPLPSLVCLHSCFQNPSRLFFLIEFDRGGDYLFHTSLATSTGTSSWTLCFWTTRATSNSRDDDDGTDSEFV